jgi:hypothetical protein
MEHPQTWLESTQLAKESQQIVSSQTHKTSSPPRPKPTHFSPPATPLKIQKLIRDGMVECKLKSLFYNCDDKYFPTKKCKEQNIFMGVTEDLSEEDVFVHLVKELPLPSNRTLPSDPPDVDTVISLNALINFSSLQNIKLIAYTKNRKFIILVDIDRTHNFIHHHIVQEINCYIRTVNNFQIMIANGGSMKCGGQCESV